MEGEGPDEELFQAAGGVLSEDATEIKGSFEEQQHMIRQLEFMSKSHEKGMENYTLRLAKMNSRLLRGRSRGRGKYKTAKEVETMKGKSIEVIHQKDELTEIAWSVETIDLPAVKETRKTCKELEQESDSSVIVEHTPISTEVPKVDSSRSKVLLLRKQLEENRVMFERQQRENIDKKIALAQMTDRIDLLSVEVESRDYLIQSLQRGDSSGADPNARILYQQILHKDNTILDLTEKVNQLEMYIQDQREQLSEKNQVIAARTEAVSLIVKDRDQKLQDTVNELEETKLSVQELKKLGDTTLSDWKIKEENLNTIISERDSKIDALEENSKRTEAVRFQLIARNAEVQDKLVALQTEMQVICSKLKMAEKKLLERSMAISELDKKSNRAEAFGQKKLKTFEKYFKSVEQDDLGERILMLSNDIALLEEEKGNLQLKLVDCDEMNVINEMQLTENMHLEAKYDNLCLELKSVSSLVTDLEKEKIFLIDNLNEINLKKIYFDRQLKSTGQEIELLRQKNISLGITITSLEEERDLSIKKLEEIETIDRNNELNSDILIKDKDYLQQRLHDRESELSKLHTIVNNLQVEHDRQIEIDTVTKQAEEKKLGECESLLQLLTDKEEFINLQSSELSIKEEVAKDLEDKLDQSRNKELDCINKIQSLEKHLIEDEELMKKFKNEVTYLKNELSLSKETSTSLRNSVSSLQNKVYLSQENNSSLKCSVSDLNRRLEDKFDLVSKLETTIDRIEDKLRSANNTIHINMQELEKCNNTISELKQEHLINSNKYDIICIEHENIKTEFITYKDANKSASIEHKTELNIISALISDKDNQIASLHIDIDVKNDQIKNNEIMVSKFEIENCDSNRKINDLNNKNLSLETELNMMVAIIADKDNRMATLNSEIEIKELQINNNQHMISNFEMENCSTNVKIDKLLSQNSNLELEIKFMKDKIEENESTVQIHLKEIKDLQNLLIEKEASVVSLNADIESSTFTCSKMHSDLELCQQSCLALQQLNGQLKEQMESLKSTNHETLSDLSSVKSNYENEIVLLRQDIIDMQSQITYMENLIETNNEKQGAEQQAIISDNSEQLTTLQQNTYELESKISEFKHQLEEKISENGLLKETLTERSLELSKAGFKLIENEENVDSLMKKMAENDNYLQEVMTEIETCQCDRSELGKKVQDLTMKLIIAEEKNENCSDKLVNYKMSKNASNATEAAILPSVSSSCNLHEIFLLREEIENISQEKKKLERDLLGAQQAIVRLETSLATQALQEDNVKERWSDWRDVDLGQKNEFEPSLQTTLMEKDRVLTMTQEQLKDALEQVNTVVDGKKQIEQQMKVLEAELQHKQKKIDSHGEEVQCLELSFQKVEVKCIELQQKIFDEGVKSDIINHSLSNQAISQSEELQKSEQQNIIVSKELTDSFETNVGSEIPPNESFKISANLEEVHYKLTWYEDMWPQWSENFNQMSYAYQTSQEQVTLLQNQLNDMEIKLQESIECEKVAVALSQDSKEYQACIKNEKELKSLQCEIAILEATHSELKTKCDKLQSFETLCFEMKTNIQELEAKRDGTNARMSELELMVQSAESEISRLRSDMQSLTNAGNSLETERSCLKEEITNLNEEIRKDNTERQRLTEENDKLQQQAAIELSSTTQLEVTNQRLCSENLQLRSEIEVLEGDGERIRTSWEFLEGECNRLRTENDMLVQNGQVLEVEKESLAHELQRLSNQLEILVSERDQLKGETQRLLELSTSAESEITRLKLHMQNMTDLTIPCQQLENQYTVFQSKIAEMEDSTVSQRILSVEDIDWSTEGRLEKEHFQQSQESDEINSIKEQILQLEKKATTLGDELYASKLKNGKMIQKLKIANTKVENIQKELEKCKSQHLTGLDATIEAEWTTQILKAESKRDEYKIKADELEKEKYNLVSQVDVLHSAQEKYLELKENQDCNQQQLHERNKILKVEVSSMEWKIAEMEEALDDRLIEVPQSEDISSLNNRINDIRKVVERLSLEKTEINIEKEHIKSKLEETEVECNKMRSILSEMKTSYEKLESDHEKYKISYLELHSEHETLINKDNKSSNQLAIVKQELNTIKYSYDTIYNDYSTLQLDRDTIKYELAIMAGEKEKLQDDLISLNNIQAALKEEEQETIIIGLQEECALQRNQNNDIKDELTLLGENMRQAEEDSSRAKNTLEQQLDIQELLRNDLNEKIIEINYLNSRNETQEKEIKYERAEVAALKSQSTQLQQTLEQFRFQFAELQTTSLKEPDASFLQQSAFQLESPASDANVTVHLNDLRCRQLSLEINKLLEERDALQLKLSSTLRQNQELGRELSLSQHLPSPPPPNALRKKLAELRELNSSLEERAMSPLNMLPPTTPTFVSHTAPPTPAAIRQTDLGIVRNTQSPGLVGWILGRGPEKEVLHV